MSTAGLDASEALVSIARERLPEADLRVGDMFNLPWEDDSFDVVTSFNGLWAGGDEVLAEVRRVLRPGGRVGVSFWGNPKRMDLVASWGLALAEMQRPEEYEAGTSLLDIGRPGVAETMLEEAGFVAGARRSLVVTTEYPDVDTTVRAPSSAGPSWAAIEHRGWDAWRVRLTELLEPFVAPSGVVRMRSEFSYLVADG